MTEIHVRPRNDDPDHLWMVASDISGGRVSKETIDAIKDYDCSKITISGLEQSTFDYFVERYGPRFREIDFFKCPRVGNLNQLGNLVNIERITYYWNQRAENLWDFSMNRKLKSFHFHDFTRMHDLSRIAMAPTLCELKFGNRIWSKYVLETLEPVAQMKALRSLTFNAKTIRDNRIEPLSLLADIRELEFPPTLFSTEKIAWLRARIPDTVISPSIAPYRKISYKIQGRNIDVLINGKRKPQLDSSLDKKRFERYTAEFEKLVLHFRNNPYLGEPD
jgi:hypothetical protein